MKKPKNKTRYILLNKEFNTFTAFRTFAWFNMEPGEWANGFEMFEDTIYKEYKVTRTERRLIIEKKYDMWEEHLKQIEELQLKLF